MYLLNGLRSEEVVSRRFLLMMIESIDGEIKIR